MTQRDLGELLNTPHTFINKYEVGERYLTFTEVINICKNLQILSLIHISEPTRRS